MFNGHIESRVIRVKERSVMASKFKEGCLGMLDRLEIDHVPIVITKRGRPVARVVPIEDRGGAASTDNSVTLVSKDDEDYFSTGETWHAET